MSILTAPLAPISQYLWFYHDYWRPQYFYNFYINNIPIGVEEVLFAFFIGGIGSVMYEFIANKRHRRGKSNHSVAIMGVVVVVILFAGLKPVINTIWASSLALIGSAAFLVALNRKLKADFAWSGIVMVVLAFAIYIALMALYPELVSRFWVEDGLSGLHVSKIPIEELFWFLSWGLFSGIIYESWINVGAYSILNRRN